MSESACPFCEVAIVSKSKLGPARTAILAGALAGASALGCSDERPATKAPPPVTDPVPAVVIDAAQPLAVAIDAAAAPVLDASAPDAGTPDAAAKKKAKKKKATKKKQEVIRVGPKEIYTPMPYGAPPARRRLV